jgi:transcriptional regulator
MPTHPAFRWEERDQLRSFVRELGFGALFTSTPEGLRVVHVPVVWIDPTTLGFHLARGGLARHLEGGTGLFVVQGPHAYVSPDWYHQGPDQVPTWNYVTVELEGRLVRMEQDALIEQVDLLSQEQEMRLAPKPRWTRAKADPERMAKLLEAIIGFRLEIAEWRGTRKLGQNKPDSARLAAADALDTQGRPEIAHWMRQAK